MTDAKLWRDLLNRLAPTLPGDWQVRGTGRQVVLVKQPVEWTLPWLGMSRTRTTDDPYLMAGVTPLVGPVLALTAEFGLRSDEVRPRPAYVKVSLSAPEAEEQVRSFFMNDAWPRMQQGTYEGHAARAERQFAQPAAERRPPWVFQQAAGWRVVLETGSPVEPARQGLEKFESLGAGENLFAFYRGLIDAWEAGSQPAALAYLQKQREATLSRLKLG